MQKNYEEEFKKKIIRLHIEEGRTIKSLSLEYSISKSAVSYWLKKFRNECRINKKAHEEQDFMKQNNKLKKELEELKKEALAIRAGQQVESEDIDVPEMGRLFVELILLDKDSDALREIKNILVEWRNNR